MGIFDSGRAALEAAAEMASEDIEFLPANGASVKVHARVGSKVFRVFDGDVSVAVTVRRFLVRVDSLPSMPTNADTISWRGRRYRLGNPDGGPPWRYHDNENRHIAIYATDFGPETATSQTTTP